MDMIIGCGCTTMLACCWGGSEASKGTLEGEEEEDGCPKYQYTKRTGDLFTSRNGRWSRNSVVKYNTFPRSFRKTGRPMPEPSVSSTRRIGSRCPDRSGKGRMMVVVIKVKD
jgi:hypothetical protein